MADRIIVRVKPYEGDYEFDPEEQPFTTLEWRWIKKISGYMPLTIAEGFKGGDLDLYLAFTVIALVRAGKVPREQALTAADRLADAPADGATIEYVHNEADAVDPPEASVTEAADAKFWRIWEADLGPFGQPPELYWTPGLGVLRPADIQDLTPAQLFAAHHYYYGAS